MRSVLHYCLLFLSAACFAVGAEPDILRFAESTHGWKVRMAQQDGKEKLAEPERKDGCLLLPIVPAAGLHAAEAVTLAPEASLRLSSASRLVFQFRLPASLPPNAVLTVFSKDNDFLWRQMRVPVVTLAADDAGEDDDAGQGEPVHSLQVPIAGRDAVDAWESIGHSRPWTALTPSSLLEFGFRFEVVAPDAGTSATFAPAELLSIAVEREPQKALAAIHGFGLNTLAPQVGKRLEATFRLDGWVPKPYDSQAFSVKADITLPDGGHETVRGYVMEDFLYDETEHEKVSCLQPHGEPLVKIRYCPRHEGCHRMAVSVVAGEETLTVPEFTFEAQPPDSGYHGFVYVDGVDKQHFSYEDGTVFQGLGMNVRSPFDDRYFHVAPYSTWRDQGLDAYAELFRKYRELGINVAEVWMCSWWLALEWKNNAPGFHGVGHYNQYRAWMLDYILNLAEENGIRLILVLNNHGKFGMTYDTEWAHNPYNKANGGYLNRCEDYFHDPRAKSDFKKTCDYIVARWGASPNILAWKLFTEVDLTGQTIEAYLTDRNIPAWHAEMGAYLKSIDIYKHPVTTHWMLGYGRIDKPTASVKELDFLSTDAYYSLGQGTLGMMNLVTGGVDFGKQFAKPFVITEFGGSSYADSMRNLMNQLEVGLWLGYLNNMGIMPMFWWFALVEDKNLHGRIAALNAFMQGEDRRSMKAAMHKADIPAQRVYELRNNTKILLWIMDEAFYFSHDENLQPPTRKALKLTLPSLKKGAEAEVQAWNTETGDRILQWNVTMKDDAFQLELPPYSRSIAVKVRLKTP